MNEAPARNQRHDTPPGRMRRVRRVHFVGIGGVGMSGIAEVLVNQRYQVTGSDLAENASVRRLKSMGVDIATRHHAENVQGADVVVHSSAIADDNPELVEARNMRIPVVERAQMLAELMRSRQGIAVAGTHGKTTTTALVAHVLGEGDLDPTFVIGGQVNAFSSHARLGTGEFLVAEADESDGSFLHLQPVIAVVTNIDQDHMEQYGHTLDTLLDTFLQFLQNLPFHGVAALCVDDEHVRDLLPQVGRHLLTFGLHDSADIRASSIRQEGAVNHFTVHLPDGSDFEASLALPGRHNVVNALGAIAVAWELGLEADAMARGLAGFTGISRRFSPVGDLAGWLNRTHPSDDDFRSVVAFEDYGHHPTELEATFEAARAGWPERRLVAVFQPHRYSRTRDLFDDFSRVLSTVDALVMLDVYPAGETAIAGFDSRSLCQSIRERGRVEPVLVPGPGDLVTELPPLLHEGDLVLFLGAGDIGQAAEQLREEVQP